MRFLLLEAEENNSEKDNNQETNNNSQSDTDADGILSDAEREQLEREWKTADEKRSEEILRKILAQMGDTPEDRKKLFKLLAPFRASCKKYGIEAHRNPFIKFFENLLRVGFDFDAQAVTNITTLVEMSESNYSLKRRITDCSKKYNSNEYLVNASLYNRTPQEFAYTVQIFENVLDPRKLEKFFKDTSEIDVKDLFEGDDIKPAGDPSTASDESTLFGQVALWSGTDGENDAGDIELSTNNSETHSRGFSNNNERKKDTKFSKLSRAQLEKIKTSNETRFTSLEAAEKAGIKDGQVVYITFNKDMTVGGTGDDNWIDTWMVRKNGKWMRYLES